MNSVHKHENEQSIRAMQLRMIGKILSSLTHEVKNHLAFIKESSGLIGDIIGSKKSLTEQDLQQSMDILYSVTKQIGKTSELCSYLNRFAHRMDRPLSSYSVNESLEELIILLQKFASQKKIIIGKDFHKNCHTVYGDPTLLQFLVFCSIEEMFRRLDKNSTITVKTDIADGLIVIGIMGKGNCIGAAEEGICSHEIQQQVITLLYGNISQTVEGTTITLPITIASTTEM